MNKYDILKETFGYTAFRAGQGEVIDALLSGSDVLAVMPTGAGKSLCYQIPALLLPGMTIVISPLISLMKDQVSALQEAGCQAAFLNSSLSSFEYRQTMDAIRDNEIKLLYIAPERLEKLSAFTEQIHIPMVVIDEAHCVSQWGHDFRTSYVYIADFIRGINPKQRPITAAFTATATVKVRSDIETLLALKKPFCITTGFDRPNLYFEVQKPAKKMPALLECLERRKNSSGIIYCATRKAVEEVSALLDNYDFSVTRYHAGLSDYERQTNQDDFLYDRKLIIVATNAFGMGIDKSNVSYVIHYNMPKNIESYYQEAGRSGRDGTPADCILLYNGQDVQINKFLISRTEDALESDPEIVAHNLELLKQMTFYATGNDCLRKRLLMYFGEQAPSYCGHCSTCLTEFAETDVTLEACKIVSCVYRLKERNRSFGKIMIIDILRGSNNEKIRRFELNTLSTWAIMKDTDAHRIRVILDHVIDEGILLLDTGEYPIVTLGNWRPLIRKERTVFMKLPAEQNKPKIEHPEEPVITSAFNEDKPFEVRSVHSMQSIQSVQSTQAARPNEDPVDQVLFDMLKKLRREIAMNEAVPAYIVFSDASLKDMCRKQPTSLDQFSAINGVGQVKLAKYGKAFTELIDDYILG